MTRALTFILLFAVFLSCKTGGKKQEESAPVPKTEKTNQKDPNAEWKEVQSAIVKIDSYDGARILESGQGFYIAENLILTRYSLVSQANRVVFSPFDTQKKYVSEKYVAIDRINDLVILYSDSITLKPILLFSGTVPQSANHCTSHLRLVKPFNFLLARF